MNRIIIGIGLLVTVNTLPAYAQDDDADATDSSSYSATQDDNEPPPQFMPQTYTVQGPGFGESNTVILAPTPMGGTIIVTPTMGGVR